MEQKKKKKFRLKLGVQQGGGARGKGEKDGGSEVAAIKGVLGAE